MTFPWTTVVVQDPESEPETAVTAEHEKRSADAADAAAVAVVGEKVDGERSPSSRQTRIVNRSERNILKRESGTFCEHRQRPELHQVHSSPRTMRRERIPADRLQPSSFPMLHQILIPLCRLSLRSPVISGRLHPGETSARTDWVFG